MHNNQMNRNIKKYMVRLHREIERKSAEEIEVGLEALANREAPRFPGSLPPTRAAKASGLLRLTPSSPLSSPLNSLSVRSPSSIPNLHTCNLALSSAHSPKQEVRRTKDLRSPRQERRPFDLLEQTRELRGQSKR